MTQSKCLERELSVDRTSAFLRNPYHAKRHSVYLNQQDWIQRFAAALNGKAGKQRCECKRWEINATIDAWKRRESFTRMLSVVPGATDGMHGTSFSTAPDSVDGNSHSGLQKPNTPAIDQTDVKKSHAAPGESDGKNASRLKVVWARVKGFPSWPVRPL